MYIVWYFLFRQGRQDVIEHDEDRSLTTSAMIASAITVLAMTASAMTASAMTALAMTLNLW